MKKSVRQIIRNSGITNHLISTDFIQERAALELPFLAFILPAPNVTHEFSAVVFCNFGNLAKFAD